MFSKEKSRAPSEEKSPLKSRDPSFLLKGEQELTRQSKWCLLDKGTECAKVKRRESNGAFDEFKESPYSCSLRRIHLYLLFFVKVK